MAIRADIELNAGTKTFASGLLVELIAALRRTRPGDLMAVVGSDRMVGPELEAWCRFTRNSLVDVTVEEGRHRWVIRCVRTGLFEPKSPLRGNGIFRAETKRPKRPWRLKDAGAETKSRQATPPIRG